MNPSPNTRRMFAGDRLGGALRDVLGVRLRRARDLSSADHVPNPTCTCTASLPTIFISVCLFINHSIKPGIVN